MRLSHRIKKQGCLFFEIKSTLCPTLLWDTLYKGTYKHESMTTIIPGKDKGQQLFQPFQISELFKFVNLLPKGIQIEFKCV